MPHWLHLMIHTLVYLQVGAAVLLAVVYACAWAGTKLRERGLDPIFREEIREWEDEMGRSLTLQEKKALATYNHG